MQKSLFHYDDYRQYLYDWFWESKKNNPKISFRFISQRLALSAPNHFHLVIEGKRNLSLAILDKLMRMMKLSAMQRQYLKLLFKENTAKNSLTKSNFKKEIDLLRKQGLDDTSQSDDRLQIVGHSLAWYIKMGASSFEDKTLDDLVAAVQNSCTFSLRKDDITAALELLIKAKQLHFENGKSQFESGPITTKWDFDSTQIKNHHKSNLNLAIESIAWPIDQRFLTGVTVSCDDEFYQNVISEIRTLCLSVLERSNSLTLDTNKNRKVITMQFAMFPYFNF